MRSKVSNLRNVFLGSREADASIIFMANADDCDEIRRLSSLNSETIWMQF